MDNLPSHNIGINNRSLRRAPQRKSYGRRRAAIARLMGMVNKYMI